MAVSPDPLKRIPTENQTRYIELLAAQFGRFGFSRSDRSGENQTVDLEDATIYRDGATLDMNCISATAIMMMITLAGGVRSERR